MKTYKIKTGPNTHSTQTVTGYKTALKALQRTFDLECTEGMQADMLEVLPSGQEVRVKAILNSSEFGEVTVL